MKTLIVKALVDSKRSFLGAAVKMNMSILDLCKKIKEYNISTRDILQESLRVSGGNVEMAAGKIGMGAANFYRNMKKNSLSLKDVREEKDAREEQSLELRTSISVKPVKEDRTWEMKRLMLGLGLSEEEANRLRTLRNKAMVAILIAMNKRTTTRVEDIVNAVGLSHSVYSALQTLRKRGILTRRQENDLFVYRLTETAQKWFLTGKITVEILAKKITPSWQQEYSCKEKTELEINRRILSSEGFHSSEIIKEKSSLFRAAVKFDVYIPVMHTTRRMYLLFGFMPKTTEEETYIGDEELKSAYYRAVKKYNPLNEPGDKLLEFWYKETIRVYKSLLKRRERLERKGFSFTETKGKMGYRGKRISFKEG